MSDSIKRLMSYPATLHKNTEWADGDSFRVVLDDDGKKRNEVIRLYYVDCPETKAGNKWEKYRLQEQSWYFGLNGIIDAVQVGKMAKKRVESLLAKPFTVHTTGARAMGMSKKPRIYGMVTLHDGRDLAAVLVQEGLARVFGKTRTRPDGVKSDEYNARLLDFELIAVNQQKGAWKKYDSTKLIKGRIMLRQNPFPTPMIDINTATIDELSQLPDIGKVTAKKIIDGRPYKIIEDLLKVKGIGKKTLEKIREYVKVE